MTKTVVASFEIDQAGGGGWLHIMPAGPIVVARDERMFRVTSASTVVAKTETPLLLDWEHESENRFGSTAAAGWGEELEVRDSGIWMRTHLTPKGKADVDGKVYRYLSPVLVIDEETRDVQQIISVALTNKPALRMEQIGKFRSRPMQLQRLAFTMRETGVAPPEPGYESLRAQCLAKGWTSPEFDTAANIQLQMDDAYRAARELRRETDALLGRGR